MKKLPKKLVKSVKRKSSKQKNSMLVYILLAVVVLLVLPVIVILNNQDKNLFSFASGATYTAGVTTVGKTMDSQNNNGISSTQVVSGSSGGTLNSISIYIGKVQAAPSNHMQVAIYADNGSTAPGTFIAAGSPQVLIANSWNTFTMTGVSITANTKYWLAFNEDGSPTQYAIANNSSAHSAWKIPTTFSVWPNPMGKLSSPVENQQYSIYMSYTGTPAMTPTPQPTAIPTTTPTTGQNTPTPIPTTTTETLTNLPAQSASVMYYGDTTRGVTYEHPGALVVTGRGNFGDPTFKAISAAGGTVLLYVDPLINEVDGTYDNMLINSSACGPAVPLWPGNPQANSSGYLLDFRVGGVEQQKLKCVLEKMVSDNPFMGGFFADDLGSRSWYPDFDWDTWGTTNQQAYRAGAIALMQTFRQVADEHGLIVIVNGTWGAGTLAASGGGYPDMNQSGNSLADGGYVEHHDSSELSYWTSYACSKQWASQSSVTHGVAFNWAVETTDSDRAAYAATNCFAYVNNQPTDNYDYAPPWGPFHYTGLPSHVMQ
jgi:hypothetical protein